MLEGSVRRAGKRVRITAQLIDVRDGYDLWSERYDREIKDVFAVQDEIAAAIAEKMKAELKQSATPVQHRTFPAWDSPTSREWYRRRPVAVDAGACGSSWIPAPCTPSSGRQDWRTLELVPERELDFVLADGTPLHRHVSECVFHLEGRRATSPVVLGECEGEALLGAVTLETLGLILNPLTRTLQPMRMLLARLSA